MTGWLKIIIIDDERLARQELANLLSEYAEMEIVDQCSNANDAIVSIEKWNPDLIFLDINMPEKSGFDLLMELESIYIYCVSRYLDSMNTNFELR